jgi:AbrB family looped-hinge helix DNA binding protein
MGFPGHHSLSVASVGTKGQIVIPLEVRERLNIGPGDKVVIMMRDNHAAVIFPMDSMRDWLDKMTADFDEMKEVVQKEAKEKGKN